MAPGAPLRADRFDCGRPGCHTRACHPAPEHDAQAACPDAATVAAWWRRAPYSVLLPTGVAFDVIEVPAPLGAAAIARRRTPGVGPVAATPTGRWMFLVRPAGWLGPELAERADVVCHARGSWVPAPPTRLPEGRVRWVVSPAEVSWQLPDSAAMQRRLAATLLAERPRTVTPGRSTPR